MFFARYNIDPLAEVGEYDVKKIMKELEGQSMGTFVLVLELDFNKNVCSKRTNGWRRHSCARQRLHNVINLTPCNKKLCYFFRQQERLDQIEKTIQQLATKVDNLLKKLEALDNVRKAKASQG